MEEEGGEFPVGMRVLAIDDDPTCLKVVEAMLRRCKYHVTTSNEAVRALNMLRENRDKFDLIITDVHMPDMDGFKLLELVGLEMDLPVIILSVNGDTQAVMKGITHGACDYLVKPVRMEELKNIWQHVIRKKKSIHKDHNHSDNGSYEVGQCPHISNGPSTHKHTGKRKDHEEGEVDDDDDDDDENMNDSENVSTHKKPRVVWTVELHRKFVAAINQLGVEKAVPKRILTLMNDESLTRENVASHLQKYRLFLRKLATQEVNIAAALGGVRDSNLPLATLDTFGNFHSFTSASQLPVLPSFQLNGGLGQRDPAHNTINPINNLNELQNVIGSQHGNNLVQRMHEANNHSFGSFSSGGLLTGYSTNHIGNITLPSIKSGAFGLNAGISSHSLDHSRFNENWQRAIPLTGGSSNLPISPLNMLKGSNGQLKYLNFGGVGNTQQQ